MIDADILEKNHLILDEFLMSPEECKKYLSKENKREPNCIYISTRGIVGSQCYDKLQTAICETQQAEGTVAETESEAE